MPRFSIFMPTHNRPQFLYEAIGGILAQDFADWELLIQDGGESVEHLVPRDPRIRYFRREDDDDLRGDAILRRAQGEILNFHADDDTLCAGTLAHVSEAIGSHQWLYGRIHFGIGGATMGDPWDYARLERHNYVPAPAVFWTREARDRVGGWDRPLTWVHDWDYWLRLGALWEPVYTPRILANYRLHPGQVTRVIGQAEKAEQEAIIRERVKSGHYRGSK